MKPINQTFFYVLIRSWQSWAFFDRCVESVLSQTYQNFKIIFIDDQSGYSSSQKKYIKEKLAGHWSILNQTRKYAIRNAYEALQNYATEEEGVVVSLDGDDWLYHRNVFAHLNHLYNQRQCWFTYGECVLWDGRQTSAQSARFLQPYTNIPYTAKQIKNKLFRLEPFYPLHLRTFKVWLYKKIKKESFLRSDGLWLRHCEDMAIYFPMLEMASQKCLVITEPLSVYNIANHLSKVRLNLAEVIKDEVTIRKMKPYVGIVD